MSAIPVLPTDEQQRSKPDPDYVTGKVVVEYQLPCVGTTCAAARERATGNSEPTNRTRSRMIGVLSLARDRAAAIGCCVTICGQAGALQPGYECPSATPPFSLGEDHPFVLGSCLTEKVFWVFGAG
jgi:hypothetical protein